MKPVPPNTGAPEIVFAADQPQFIPVTVSIYEYEHSKGLLTRWELTEEERVRVAAGEDIYIMQLNYRTPMTPMKVRIGPEEFLVKDPTDLS
jgi:hypothetical protein